MKFAKVPKLELSGIDFPLLTFPVSALSRRKLVRELITGRCRDLHGDQPFGPNLHRRQQGAAASPATRSPSTRSHCLSQWRLFVYWLFTIGSEHISCLKFSVRFLRLRVSTRVRSYVLNGKR